jgi:Carboxypeptidase regulatory-like domain/TonB dependent receptor-like, beta-barrel/TonB-dependent Receptor Plug Domain
MAVPGTRPKSPNRIRAVPLAIMVYLYLVSARLLAQATGTTTGDLRGRVTDESGAVRPGVLVTATSLETGLARTDTTGSDGRFAVRLLPPATYRVAATLQGFQPLEVSAARVALGSSTNLDLRLAIATVAESVTVAARSGLIDHASTDVSKAIGETMIRNLPINQRNFLEFSLTTPGVTADRGPQTGAASTSGLSFNGQSPRYNNVLVDGLDNNDQAVGSVRSTFSQEAVQEYQVIQSPFASEYGRAAGGIVNIVTRSGSNDFHGSAFDYFRDESLAGNNFLTGTKTPFRQNQYGASFGGPLVRDRLFFFGAAERLDVSDANVVAISDEAVSVIRQAGFDVENGVVPFGRDRSAYLLKLDWVPGSSDTFALRGTDSRETDENQQAWGGLIARSGGGVRKIEDTALALTGASIFSSSLSNELRLLYADRSHRLESLDPTGGVSVTILGVATFGNQRLLPQPRDTRIYEVFDALSLFRGRSSYKLGLDYVRTELQGRLPLYFAGFYEFSALSELSPLDAFAEGHPTNFAQGFGDPAGEGSTNEFGAFAQGEWYLGERFLLRLGLRYDLEDPIAPFPRDSDNWSPRLSFSWAGGDTWRVRGGAGRFYGVVPIGPAFAVGIENGVRARTIVRTVLGGPPPDEPWQLPDHRFGNESEAGASVVPLSVFRPGRFESVYSDQASLGVEKEIAGALLLNLDYLHVRGRKILIERNINPVIDELGRRPDPDFSEIFLYESAGNSWYDALTAGLRTRLGGRFEIAAYYSYAVAEDDYIDWSEGQPQDPLNIVAERGPTLHVPRHKAVLSAVYSTVGRAGAWWERDWTVAMIADFLAGLPYNELAGFDRNGNGDPLSDRPAHVGRNSRSLPALFNVDFRIARQVRVRRAAIEGIVEVFNLFNRKNVLEVNNVRFASAELDPNTDFGRPTRTSDPRRIQVGARLTF